MNNKELLIKYTNDYKLYIIKFVFVLLLFAFAYYIYTKLSLKKNNCDKLDKINQLGVKAITDDLDEDIITNYFIKTAYNCCCTGNFKNDYVELCSLKNCAKQGVRALDFQIYSLKNKPIISASTVNNNKYKEIYNYLEFYDTMLNVKRFFMNDPTYSSNNSDPLFLIFRLYSKNSIIYDMMGNTLNEIFGYSNPSGNLIYIVPVGKTLDTESIKNLKNKVIIIIDPTYGDPTKFNSSKLNSYNSLTIGTLNNIIYREKEVFSQIKIINNNAKTNLTFLYPELEFSSHNYDFTTTGIFNNI